MSDELNDSDVVLRYRCRDEAYPPKRPRSAMTLST